MLKDDSRKIKKGDIFIALKGTLNDGHDYIDEAIKNGACMVICEHGDYNCDTICLNDTKKFLNNYLKLYFPDIKVIGITGTNGKTTTAFLIYQALNMLDVKCAYIGTIGFYIDKKICDLKNTTPSSLDLFEMINEAYESGCKYISMEVSSHALDQGRCDFINFDYAFFTNLTRDHLDYHYTMENYALAKQKLFKNLSKLNIVNIDSPYKDYFLVNNYITYGFNLSDYRISNNNGFYLNQDKYITHLYGKYNLYNISCVIILLQLLNIDKKKIKQVIKKLKAPEGRMKTIKYKNNTIIIDFAHTPDAMENVIKSLDKYNHLYIIFGCGGERDRGKRPIMGNIATKYASYTIITNDNPRGEDENDIVRDILSGIINDKYEIELNRVKAVQKGIQLLEKNDILLLLGKGHEKYQALKNGDVYYSDLEEVLKCIRR